MDPTGPPNRRPSQEQTDARRAEIDKHWCRQRKRAAGGGGKDDNRLAHLRLRELQRCFRHRHGLALPDSDPGRGHLVLLLGYAILAGKRPDAQVELIAPWLRLDEADHLVHVATTRRRLHDADELAHLIGLTYAERQALGITTIGAVDVDRDGRERLRRTRAARRKREKRAAGKAAAAAAPTEITPKLTPREAKVLARIGVDGAAVPELIDRVAGLKEFWRLASPRQQVHRIVDRLVKRGIITDRTEPSPRGGRIRYVNRRQD